jgi:uncharacterized protein (DUF1786 family)
VAQAIGEATRAGDDLLLTGVTMGGGPCGWAAEEHLRAGRRIFATPEAARTFNDDLVEVEAMGVRVVGEDEAARIQGARRVVMADLDYAALARAFGAFGVDLDRADLVAVASFDHGAAPPGVSDRLFRFEYLAERLRTGAGEEGTPPQSRPLRQGGGQGLAAFAFAREAIPPSMTRLRAAASGAPAGRPAVAMDTAPAAVLGALEDPAVRARRQAVVANVGNFHTLAFALSEGAIAGLFEHHTGRLTRGRLEDLLEGLAAGTLSQEELFADHGHGALVLERAPGALEFVAVTGPRRGLLAGSRLRPYLAVPHGDMMMAGCWGLVRASAQVLPWAREEIERALGPG